MLLLVTVPITIEPVSTGTVVSPDAAVVKAAVLTTFDVVTPDTCTMST
jgi:hypothetical protein